MSNNKRKSIVKSLIAIAAMAGPLAVWAQDTGDCSGPAPQTLAAPAAREIGIEQAARFGLTLPCPRLAGKAADEAQRRQMVADLEAELTRRRHADAGRDGFRPERYGLALPTQPLRAVKVATTAGYDALVRRPERIESGG